MTPKGRPRAFDRDAALVRAMELFWAKGYEGASMAMLTEAMGINSPSLYACFGSKAELFKEAVSVYRSRVGHEIWNALPEAKTAREGFHNFLKETAISYTRPDQPQGCLIVLGALHGLSEDDPIGELLRENRRENVTKLKTRLEQGVADGELGAATDCQNIAEFYATVQHGMSITARDGATLDGLMRTADAAMAAWDGLTAS